MLQDSRQALRLVSTSSATTLLVVVTIVIGLAAGFGVFSVFHRVLVSELPYTDSDRLLVVLGELPDRGLRYLLASAPNVESWQQALPPSLEALEAVSPVHTVTLQAAERPAPAHAEFVSSGYLSLLGLAPIVGSTFDGSSSNQVLLAEQFWRTHFSADPEIIGTVLRLDRQAFEVVGVLPTRYRGLEWDEIDIVLPLGSARSLRGAHYLEDRSRGWLIAVARRSGSASAAQAGLELVDVSGRLEEQYSSANDGYRTMVVPLDEYYYQDSLRRGLQFLLIAGGFVLILCFANAVGLLNAVIATRARSVAIRLAMGSTRWQVTRPFLTYTFALALLGSAGALLITPIVTNRLLELSDIFPAGIEPQWFSRDILVLAGALVLSLPLVTGLLTIPLLRRLLHSRVLATGRLDDRGSSRTSQGLSILQVGLASALLLGVGLLAQSLQSLSRPEAGFATENLGLLRFDLGSLGDAVDRSPRDVELIENVYALPGTVSAVLWGPRLPPSSLLAVILMTEEHVEGEPAPQVFRHAIGPRHLETLGVEVSRGRAIDARDQADTLPVAVVSRTVADEVWPDGAIGSTFRTTPELRPDTLWTVVGVIPDIKARGRRQLGLGDVDVYFPLTQVPTTPLYLTFRSSVDPRSLEPALHDLVHRLEPDLALHPVETMRERYADTAADERFATVLTGIFSLVALVIAAIGIYGVASLSVTRRTRELGIRMALGARRLDVLWMVLRQSFGLVAVGLGLGVVLALSLYRFLQGFLFGVGLFDPPTVLGVVGILGLVALLSSLGPALRATRIDPSVAMRAEG